MRGALPPCVLRPVSGLSPLTLCRYQKSVFREEMCKRAMPVGDAPLKDPRERPFKYVCCV